MGNSLGGACALRMALDRPERVGRLVLMGPGGVGISESKPTDGLKRLLGYYAGEGPTLEKLRKFICEDLDPATASRRQRRGRGRSPCPARLACARSTLVGADGGRSAVRTQLSILCVRRTGWQEPWLRAARA